MRLFLRFSCTCLCVWRSASILHSECSANGMLRPRLQSRIGRVKAYNWDSSIGKAWNCRPVYSLYMFFLSLAQLAYWLQCALAASQHSQIPDRSFRCAQRNLIKAGKVPLATSILWVSSVGVFFSKLVISLELPGCQTWKAVYSPLILKALTGPHICISRRIYIHTYIYIHI